jgi:hypothetical protein
MVNYARMETVWRSYGPLEPIGPSKPKSRRPVKATIAGLVVVCLAGAAGIYFRPDLEAAEAPTRAAPPLVRADSGEAAPGGDLDEAARLQSQLEMLVLDRGRAGHAAARGEHRAGPGLSDRALAGPGSRAGAPRGAGLRSRTRRAYRGACPAPCGRSRASGRAGRAGRPERGASLRSGQPDPGSPRRAFAEPHGSAGARRPARA